MRVIKTKLHFWIVGLWAIGSLLFFLIPHSSARYGNAEAATVSVHSDILTAGSRLFTPTCDNGYCHGKDGTGGSAPPLRGKKFTAEYVLRVLNNGISGTAMPSFKTSYSQLEREQIAAYVEWLSKYDIKAVLPPLPKSSDAKNPIKPGENPNNTNTTKPLEASPAKSEASAAEAAKLRGDAKAGQAIFFDATNDRSCRACHAFQGRGGKLAPDLSNLNTKSARDILLLIVTPHTNVAANYATIILTTKEGERVVGIKRDEDDESIKIYDTSSLPPVSRTFQKANLSKIEPTNTSIMPGDYSSRYTLKQLLDLIAFLKAGESSAQSTVSMKDLFN